MFYLLLIVLLIVLLYLFFTMPAKRSLDLTSYLGWDYAHRGFHDNKGPAPENSLLAIKKAVDNSYGIEFDIRLSKDGQVLVFHDFDLKRMCGLDKRVRDLDYSDLKKLKLLDSEQTIPLFSQVLEEIAGRVPIIVELKCLNDEIDELASKACKLLDSYKGPFMVESFNPFAIKWFKKNRPAYIRGQLSSGDLRIPNFLDNFLMKELLVNLLSRPDFVAYEHKYRDKFALKVQKHLWKTLMVSYTIKNKEEYDINKEFFYLLIFEGFKPQ